MMENSGKTHTQAKMQRGNDAQIWLGEDLMPDLRFHGGNMVRLDIVDDGWQDWSGAAGGNNLGKEVGSAVEQWRDSGRVGCLHCNVPWLKAGSFPPVNDH